MRIIKLTTVCAVLACVSLVACSSESGSTSEAVNVSGNDASSVKSEGQAKAEESSDSFEVLITETQQLYTDPERQDPMCSVAITLTNNTGKEVDLFQLKKYSVAAGDYKHSSHGSTFNVEDGQSSTRAGIQFPHVLCSAISQIQIDEYQCLYKGFGNQGTQGYECKDNVVFKGNGQMGFSVSK